MTECDRLISQGALSPDFLKSEVRCDFNVTPERKKLWAIQLDLFARFREVCDRHGLRYSAIGGTILGALRHRGFIPWDDDIDLVMPRTDYERLWELADEFRHPYFLQIPGRDADYAYSLTKLRNSNTTQICNAFAHCRFNQGVLIDIIPLDPWCRERGRELYPEINALNVDNANFMRQRTPNPDDDVRRRIAAWSGRLPAQNLAEIRRLATRFAQDPAADTLTTPVTTFYPYDKIMFPKACFDSFVEVPFENTTMVVPAEAERVLEIQFGDWRTFPPPEKRGAWHADELFDPDEPFTSFLRSPAQ